MLKINTITQHVRNVLSIKTRQATKIHEPHAWTVNALRKELSKHITLPN